jgi:class 3 adenylate cyclase
MPGLWTLIAVLVVLALGVVGWLWWRRRGAQGEVGRCARCGYEVSGLPTFTCPECGSDLREVGIVRRDAREAGIGPLPLSRDTVRLIAALGGWTALYGAMYAFLGARSYPASPWDTGKRTVEHGLVDAYLWPYRGSSTHSVALEPRSGGYRRVVVTESREARFNGWRNAPQVRWTGDSPNVGLTRFGIVVELETLEGKGATLEVDPTNLSWSFDDPLKPGTRQSGGPLDAAAVHGWLLMNGVTLPSPAIADEALAVADLVTASARSGYVGGAPWAVGRLERIAAGHRDRMPAGGYAFASMRGTAQDAYGPAWSIYWLSIPFGLGVYTYGTNWIFTRHKRRLGLGDDGAPVGRRSRTLTILFTDLKDYTARTASASREALRGVLRANRHLVEAAVRANGGTIVKAMGDAYLVTFESATDAVLAGVEVQRAAAAHNAGVAESERLAYRIAVCTGEVTLDDGDVFGTPVNVAARVQALAEPGDVVFTESTLHALNAAEVAHEALGARELKGVPAPVNVYRAKA